MIAIGSDHGGFHLKEILKQYLKEQGIDFQDVGTDSEEACDYPDIAKKVVKKIREKEADKGILLCGTGIGISIAANRYPGIRAAVVTNEFTANACRAHNNANILCMGGRVTGDEEALTYLKIFLETPFSEDERHIRRIRKIEEV